VGILGFFPNPLVSPTGLFVVNTAHNIVHLASGAVLLAGAYSTLGASLALKIVGVVYALVATLGLIMGGPMLLGLVAMNTADHWLHVILAVVILAAGFLLELARKRRFRTHPGAGRAPGCALLPFHP
jgi:Domain of unknown function (DUF4383)